MSLLSKAMVGRTLGDIGSFGLNKYYRDKNAQKLGNKKAEALNLYAASQTPQQSQETEYDKAQKAALERLQQISQGGETPAERQQREALAAQRQQAYGEARRQLSGQMASATEANKAAMARRGIGGGGAEIAQNVAGQQNLANAMAGLGGQQSAQEAEILANQGMQAQQRRDAATQAIANLAQGQQELAQQGKLAMLGGASNLWNAIQARKQQRRLTQQQMAAGILSGAAAGGAYGLAS